MSGRLGLQQQIHTVCIGLAGGGGERGYSVRGAREHTQETQGQQGEQKEVEEDRDGMSLTKGRDDGTCDAVGHGDSKDAHGPGVLQAKLELIGLTLQTKTQKNPQWASYISRYENADTSTKGSTDPFDVDPLGLGLSEAEADGVHRQRRDPEQLHGRADQAGRDHVVYKERTVVGKEHAPAPRTRCWVFASIWQVPPHFILKRNRLNLLEFDFLLLQEVDIKEPGEEQVQTAERKTYRKIEITRRLLSTLYNSTKAEQSPYENTFKSTTFIFGATPNYTHS